MYYDQAVQAAPDDWLVTTCFYPFYFFNGFVSLNQLLSSQCICNPYEVLVILANWFMIYCSVGLLISFRNLWFIWLQYIHVINGLYGLLTRISFY